MEPGEKQISRLDVMGDPLPPDALMRLGSIRLRHGITLQALAYSPVSELVASGGWNPHIRVWDTATGKEVLAIAGPQKGVRALAYSPDGKLLAGGGIDGVIYLWDAPTGKEIRRFEGGGAEITALKFSPQGDRLAASAKGAVRLWEVSGKPRERLDLKEGEGEVVAIDFAPDGQRLAVASDKTVKLWQAKSGALREIVRKQTGISSVLFSKDGKHLLSTGNGIAILPVADDDKIHTYHNLGVPIAPAGVAALSPDGKILAFGDSQAAIQLWDWAAGKKLRELPRVPDRVRCLAFSSDGKTLAALADGAPIHLWDATTGQRRIVAPGHQERVTAVAYLRDGTVVTAAWDGTVRLWDAKSGKETRRIQLDLDKEQVKTHWLNPATVRQISVSQDDKLVAAILGHELAILWDTATGKEMRRFNASAVAFSPDGKLIACGQRGTNMGDLNAGVIHLYDRATGKDLRELRGHLTTISSMAFTPDSKMLVSQGMVLFGLRGGDPGEDETKFVRVWDVASGKERQTFAGGGKPHGTILSADGRTGAGFAFLEKTITLWETVSGGQRGELTGNQDMVFDVAFSPDGRLVASAGMDGSVRVFDPFTSKEVGRLQGHLSWVQSVAFAPDGKTLVSGSIDTTALIWDVSRFSALGKAAEVTDAELETCWTDLGRDAEIAYRAIGRLLAAPERALALFRKNLKPAPSAQAERIAQLIADLDSKEFKTRERATLELEKLGDVAAPAVQKALVANLPLEMHRRLELLLQKLEGATLPPDTLRQVRAVEVLQGIGTSATRELLEHLVAEGAPDARLTREAKAALSSNRDTP